MRTRVALALSAALLALVPCGTEAASSINTTLPVQGAPFNAAPIRQNFQAAANDINALQSLNAGASAPASPGLGTMWLDTSSTPYLLKTWSVAGSQWVTIAGYNQTTALWMPPVGGGTIPSITSAATTNLASSPAAAVSITGNQAIASFGTVPEGQVKFLAFTGSASLVYNATYMILPGAANITMSPGSTAIAISLGGGRWRIDTSDMNGPSSGEDGAVALFSGTTGKMLKTGIVDWPGSIGSTPVNIAKIDIGGYPLANQIPSGIVQGLAVSMKTPAGFVNPTYPNTAISAYLEHGQGGGANASSVGYFAYAGISTDGGTPGGAGSTWAANFVAANCSHWSCAAGSGVDSSIHGLEIDLNVVNKGASAPEMRATGLLLTGNAVSQPVHGAYAINIRPLHPAAPFVAWNYGLFTEDGATSTAIFLGAQSATAADTASQILTYQGKAASSQIFMATSLDTGSYLNFLGTPDAGGVRALNIDARNAFLIDASNVLTRAAGCVNLFNEAATEAIHLCNTVPQNVYRNTTHVFQSADALTNFGQIDVGGAQINVAGTAIATNAVGPFLYTSAGAGAPTGVPTHAAAGRAAIYVDTTNHTICFYEQPTTTWTCK